MLSIGITVCDKDYKNCSDILNQIKERVKVEHEVIIIDNREKYKDEPTDWESTFAFGYNAYQFSARAKIIELAKGDYLWFVDGDDEVGEVKSLDYDEDILAFSYATYPVTNVHLEPAVYTENIFSYEMADKICHVLWNKFYKKSLFTKEYIDKFYGVKMVTAEDTIWNFVALKNAKSLRMIDEIVYYHKEGLTNRLGIITLKEVESLLTGFDDMQRIMKDILGDTDFYRKSMRNTYNTMMIFVPRCQEMEKALKLIMDKIPKEEFREAIHESLLPRLFTSEQLKEVINIVDGRYGKGFSCLRGKCMVTYEDGRIEEYEFVKTIDFDDEPLPAVKGKWKHNLSIVLLVYDGNTEYLCVFVEQIRKRVLVDYEIIIVDNRNDKTFKLDFKDAVIVDAKQNVGILEGRRLGFEASHNDYVWFIDIDDIIVGVDNQNYPESDMLVFPFFMEENFTDRKTYCSNEGQVVNKKDFFTADVIYNINVLTWNKWIKREILEKAYKDIPQFFCIYHEDNILMFTVLKYAQCFQYVNTTPIYAHISNEKSITTKIVKDQKSVDTMFIGFEEATQYMKDNFNFCSDISYKNPFDTVFYLQVMDRALESVKPYFAQKLISLFGYDDVFDSIDFAKKHGIDILRIKKYFKND